MGVSSNLEVFLSEKHLNNDNHKDREFINSTILAKSSAMEQTNDKEEECHHASTKQQQTTVQEQRNHEQGKEEEEEEEEEDSHHQVIMQEQQQSNKDYDDDDDKNGIVVPALVVLPAPLGLKKLKIPPYKEEKEDSSDDEEDGFKTPTSPQHRIPAMLQCPPAPRKPQSTWSSTTKRKGSSCVVLDFSQDDIESLFPKKLKLQLFTETEPQ